MDSAADAVTRCTSKHGTGAPIGPDAVTRCPDVCLCLSPCPTPWRSCRSCSCLCLLRRRQCLIFAQPEVPPTLRLPLLGGVLAQAASSLGDVAQLQGGAEDEKGLGGALLPPVQPSTALPCPALAQSEPGLMDPCRGFSIVLGAAVSGAAVMGACAGSGRPLGTPQSSDRKCPSATPTSRAAANGGQYCNQDSPLTSGTRMLLSRGTASGCTRVALNACSSQ